MSKLITIEGTDCSGKGTQTKLLYERLISEKVPVKNLGFPMYDTPTGKIVGGPYLGKKHICEGWFLEGASNVESEVASLYYAADRKYNSHKIVDALNDGYSVLLDRYVESNMAYHGGRFNSTEKRIEMYKWCENLEYGLLKLPRPDLTIFLYMPYQYALELKKNREEAPDQIESSEEHLKIAEKAYIELAELYGFEKINCVRDNQIRTPQDIHEEIFQKVRKKIGF